jgi:hypothetical protein
MSRTEPPFALLLLEACRSIGGITPAAGITASLDWYGSSCASVLEMSLVPSAACPKRSTPGSSPREPPAVGRAPSARQLECVRADLGVSPHGRSRVLAHTPSGEHRYLGTDWTRLLALHRPLPTEVLRPDNRALGAAVAGALACRYVLPDRGIPSKNPTEIAPPLYTLPCTPLKFSGPLSPAPIRNRTASRRCV